MFLNSDKNKKKRELKALNLFDGDAGTTLVFHSDIKLLFPDKPIRDYETLLSIYNVDEECKDCVEFQNQIDDVIDEINGKTMQDLREDGFVIIEFKLAKNDEKQTQKQIPVYTLTEEGARYRDYLAGTLKQSNKPSLPEP